MTGGGPGQTRVVQLFGRDVGTVRRTGLVLTVPLTTRKNVSVRVRNFETNELKVNDADGNPINIAAIVVWQVADTATATFAGAIIAARERIVEGAVSMVEGALGRLEADGIVQLDDERRTAMVSNLLVVLCGESRATPVVNAGSLYA